MSPRITDHDWDYRWMEYPAHARTSRHPLDQSWATYRDHSVLRTLIRCYFSLAYRFAAIMDKSTSTLDLVIIWSIFMIWEILQELQMQTMRIIDSYKKYYFLANVKSVEDIYLSKS
ncbi:hypothetical protein ABKV19_009519 [Rosa sericea]